MAESKVFESKDYKNIIDYVYQNGERKFTELEFNVLDNAVLSAFSYIPFELFEKANRDFKEKTLKEVCLDYFSWIRLDYLSEHFPDWLRKSIFLAMAMFTSKRYADVLMTDFCFELSHEESTQFGAFNALLPDGTSCTVFRGTDNSILGWREDFDLACYDSVKGQLSAKNFLNRMMKKYPERRFRVMGHSKGGNLAVYAGCFIPKTRIDRILRIYSNDGPGMNKNVFSSAGHDRIQNRITHIVVQEDIVGCLLIHERAEYVVLSGPKGNFPMQHDIYNWRVDDLSFVKVDRLSPESKYLTESINEWLDSTIPDASIREKLVTSIFEAQGKTGVTEVGTILDNPKKFAVDFLRGINNSEKSEKRLMTKAFLSLIRVLIKNYPQYVKDRNEYVKSKNVDGVKNVPDKVAA